jgi:hypothetical protein
MVAAKSLLRSASARLAVSVMGRAGYVARGTIYALIGISAARATFDPAHAPGGFSAALKLFQHGWAGGIVLVLLASALACFAGWLAIAAMYRRDHPGRAHYVLVAGMLGDAVIYAAFVAGVLGMVFGASSGGEHQLQSWIGWLIASPGGRILVALAGVVVFACGAGLIGWAAVSDVEGPLELTRDEKRWVQPIGRYGAGGRGVAIALVGGYLFVSGLHGNASEAHELGGVLGALRGLPYGAAITGAFALAFIGSSVSDFVIAVFRRFDPTDPLAAGLRGRRRASRRSSGRGR